MTAQQEYAIERTRDLGAKIEFGQIDLLEAIREVMNRYEKGILSRMDANYAIKKLSRVKFNG